MRAAGKAAWALALAGGAAALLRLLGASYGLPHTFNADEPHLVNLAVSFGGGSLKPYLLKYPTLWPYLLAAAYGAYFLVWSGFGLLHSVTEFAGLFAWRPTGFYLIGRVLSALFSLAGVVVVGLMERSAPDGKGARPRPWGALALAFSPVLVELSHSAKPDNLMFFLAASGWFAALKVYRGGARAWYWASGAFFGLALSSQYTALPALVVLPLAHLLGRSKSKTSFLAEGLAAAAACFLLGSPYVLLDFPAFRASVADMSSTSLFVSGTQGRVAASVLRNICNFAGSGSLAGFAAVVGALALLRRDARMAALLLLPVAVYAALLGSSPDGGWMRYLLGCFPALALLAGEGLRAMTSSKRPVLSAALAAAALLPGVAESTRYVRGVLLPDTRTLSGAWIRANVPPGSTLLLDMSHAGPLVTMTRDQIEELRRKTEETGSPRARLYRAMAETHPGGGYRVYRIQRSAKDLWSGAEHVAKSQADSPTLDLRPGLDPARAVRVDYVVTSSFGATPARSPELASFFEELNREGELLREFLPEPDRAVGPALRVYRMARITGL